MRKTLSKIWFWWFVFMALAVVFSCSSRHKTLSKTENTAQGTESADVNVKTNVESSNSGTYDLSKLADNMSIKVVGNGTDYNLNYGGVVFSGSADIEISRKQEHTTEKTTYKSHTTYYSVTDYKTHTTYKSLTKTKDLEVSRKGITAGTMAIVIVLSMVLGAFLWESIKNRVKL